MDEQAPFVFGRLAKGNDFTDREQESVRLMKNFSSRINTILISPRRWGKSSLVARAAERAARKDKQLRFCFIDLFNVRSEAEFYQLLAESVIKASTTKWEERMQNIKTFFRQIIPSVSMSPEPNSEFSMKFNLQEVKKKPDEILNLAENISKQKKIKLVVCVDEFQNISFFDDALSFQKKLRAAWQQHQIAAYCLYGSKRHMMMDVFASSSMPFYKFGDLMFLEKIQENDWIEFITKRFSDTGKKIKPEVASHLAMSVSCHPYYVQQLAQLSWLQTAKQCDIDIVERALDTLQRQLGLLFQTITDGLSNTQVNFMRAVLEGATQLSSQENLRKYRLGTSANVVRIKQALIGKEILDMLNENFVFLDPMYEYWLRSTYFKTTVSGIY